MKRLELSSMGVNGIEEYDEDDELEVENKPAVDTNKKDLKDSKSEQSTIVDEKAEVDTFKKVIRNTATLAGGIALGKIFGII